jgi:hypothetical protein
VEKAASRAKATVSVLLQIRPLAAAVRCPPGDYVMQRFAIPERFDPQYLVSFESKPFATTACFAAGAASTGRESESIALYANAAYFTAISNEFGATVRRLESLEARAPRSTREDLRD